MTSPCITNFSVVVQRFLKPSILARLTRGKTEHTLTRKADMVNLSRCYTKYFRYKEEEHPENGNTKT